MATQALTIVTKTSALAELFAVLDQLDAAQVCAVTHYAQELADGADVPAVERGIVPLTDDQTPYAGLFNSVLGFTPDGGRKSGR